MGSYAASGSSIIVQQGEARGQRRLPRQQLAKKQQTHEAALGIKGGVDHAPKRGCWVKLYCTKRGQLHVQLGMTATWGLYGPSQANGWSSNLHHIRCNGTLEQSEQAAQ